MNTFENILTKFNNSSNLFKLGIGGYFSISCMYLLSFAYYDSKRYLLHRRTNIDEYDDDYTEWDALEIGTRSHMFRNFIYSLGWPLSSISLLALLFAPKRRIQNEETDDILNEKYKHVNETLNNIEHDNINKIKQVNNVFVEDNITNDNDNISDRDDMMIENKHNNEYDHGNINDIVGKMMEEPVIKKKQQRTYKKTKDKDKIK
jgi:hypothetical protein